MNSKEDLPCKSNFHPLQDVIRAPKTPVVCLERLKIPLDSNILVKGGSIIYPVDCASKNPTQVENVSITISDDDINENESFREIISDDDFNENESFRKLTIEQIQSTRKNSVYSKSEPSASSKTFESLLTVKSMSQEKSSKSNTSFTKSETVTNVKKPADGNQKQVIKQYPPSSKKTSISMSDLSGRVRKLLAHKKQVQVRNAAKRFLGNAEMHIQKRIETAGFSNVSTINKSLTDKTFNKNSNSHFSGNKSNPNGRMLTKKRMKSIWGEKHSPETDEIDATVSDFSDTPIGSISNKTNENSADFTPSRVSERIKNKKVKFSALKLLAGEDIWSSERKSYFSKIKKRHGQRKSFIKTNASKTADDITFIKSRLPIVSREQDLSEVESTSVVTGSKKKSVRSYIKTSSPIESNMHEDVYTAINAALNEIKQKLDETKIEIKDSMGHSKNLEHNNRTSDSVSDLTTKNTDSKKVNLIGKREIVKASTCLKNKSGVIKNVSNKIKLQLQGAPEKKVVNISIKESLKIQAPVRDELKKENDVELGPDIIIRRVKSEKKQLSREEQASEGCITDKSISVREQSGNERSDDESNSRRKVGSGKSGVLGSNTKEQTDSGQSVVHANQLKTPNLIVRNRVYPEMASKNGANSVKEVEVPPQIKKLILEGNKNKKPINFKSSELLMSKINAIAKEPNTNNEKDGSGTTTFSRKRKKSRELCMKKRGIKPSQRKDGDDDLSDQGQFNDMDTLQVWNTTSEDDSFKDSDQIKEQTNKDLNKLSKGTNLLNRDDKLGENKKNIDSFSTGVNKISEKKTAKVTPLRQVDRVQSKSECIKKSNDKTKLIQDREFSYIQKSKVLPQLRSSEKILNDTKCYKNTFEKYFICSDKIYEYKDIRDCDSDGSSEDDIYLSHFIDLKRTSKEVIEENDDIEPLCNIDNGIIKDVIKDIMTELPHWNWHLLPDGPICLILLEKEEDGNVNVKKCIEIDKNLNANVHVNKVIINEYCGVYDSFDDIKNLIYQIDLL